MKLTLVFFAVFVVGKCNASAKTLQFGCFVVYLTKNDKFPNMEQFAMKILVLFASTYICEQTFSCMWELLYPACGACVTHW